NPWPWPSQAHVFCENDLGDGHRQILKTVYADAYNDHINDIENGALLRAWGEQVLLALVLKLIADKLITLMRLSLDGKPIAAGAQELERSLIGLRNLAASYATGDRTEYANAAIALWSRMVSLYRIGHLPSAPNAYQPISGTPVAHLLNDANA